MGYTTVILFACVCLAYLSEGRSLDQSGRRLVTRGSRTARAKYQIGGYLYGKRSQVTEDSELNTVSRQYMTIEDFVELLEKDIDFATMVAKSLDRNGDGYIQLMDLLK